MVPEDGVDPLGSVQHGLVVHRFQPSRVASKSGLLLATCDLRRNRCGDLFAPDQRGLPPVKLTREAFAGLFGVHLSTGVPSAWVRGVRYVFVAGNVEIEELERLLGGV